MTDQNIPPELHDFILGHIDSIAYLEALLLLHANPDQGWDSEKVSQRLYITPDQKMALLEALQDDGFIDMVAGEYRFTGGSVDQRKLIDQLATFYASHIVAVTNVIHSKPRRIREFAKAFRFKREN